MIGADFPSIGLALRWLDHHTPLGFESSQGFLVILEGEEQVAAVPLVKGLHRELPSGPVLHDLLFELIETTSLTNGECRLRH
jgi:hypothetical protein